MKAKIQNISFFISLILYNYFFWKESLGINLFLFAILIILNLFILYRESFRTVNVLITLTGTILTAITVVVFNSFESKLAHIFSFLLMVAFIHETQLRSVVYAAMHVVSSFMNIPLQFYRKKNNEAKKYPKFYSILRIARLSVIPLFIAVVFYLLYISANPIFGKYAESFWDKVSLAITNYFVNISFERIFFLFTGALILAVIYFRNETKIFLQKDLSFTEKLFRIKKLRRKKPVAYSSITRQPIYSPSKPKFNTVALKNQNRRGVILFLMVNILLLIENFIDIKWLWMGFNIPEGFSLKHYVREGTGFLIVSILLSITLMLYYFRKNQNFYQGNKLLKSLAYIWIFQNVILCISVFFRNDHYIDFHGLAYKRIGVIAFITLTVFGLATLYYKIKNVRSPYYLLRMNTWAVYFMLVTLSCFNWDVRIAEYNLAHWNKGEIDVDFYLKLSDKALPVIYANLDSVKVQIQAHQQNKVRWIRHLDYDNFVTQLDRRTKKFLERHEQHSWLSFNVPDERAYVLLSKRKFAEY